MPAQPVDTSLTGYLSGSVDRQDDIYRDRQRPQPYPLVQNDSGYESATHASSSSLLASSSPSLIGLANSVKCSELLDNHLNFAPATVVECYQSDSHSIKRQRLDESGFHDCLRSTISTQGGDSSHRVLLFLTTLDSADGAKYKARSSFSKAAVEALISSCNLNPLFVPDLLGRPNYWAPSLYSTYDSKGNLASVDFFCQQPRFGIHSANFKQRSPVSIYMRYEATKNLTYYIISAPESEEAITSFKSLLDLASQGGSGYSPIHAFQHPLEAHILLSKILCESSQDSINHFRQSMFAQLRTVDELSVQESSDTSRKGLAKVTIELQIISKDVNKLISDVDVALRNLVQNEEALSRFDQRPAHNPSASNALRSPSSSFSSVNNDVRQQLIDTLQYLNFSMDKQKMWLHNYRDRKDIAMSLVFNLVTQQDAANNIEIAKDMKRDSSSMNGIALLTMVFLPGTFTSTVLGAGLFSAYAQHRQVHVSGMWWFWAALTFPLTGFVLLLWGALCWRKEFRTWWARTAGGGKKYVGTGNNDDVEAKG